MKQIVLFSLLIVLQLPTSGQTTTDKCTLENARAWLTRPPADYELAFTHAWPGREAKFPPKNYFFVVYRGNHLLIKSTNAIPFDSQTANNPLPHEGTMMGKNGSVFWVLNERNGTSEMLVWTNRLVPSEINNEVLNTHRSSVESLQLVRRLGIQTLPIESLKWEGVNFSYNAETNGAFLRGSGNFVSNLDGSIRDVDYSYERSNSADDVAKKLSFGVKYAGAVASAGFVLPQQLSIMAALKDRKPFVAYSLHISRFATVRMPPQSGIFDFVNYITPEKTRVFFVEGTNLLYQASSGRIQAVIPDPNDPRIIRQKNTLNSRNAYFLSAVLLACFPVAFMAIKLWNKRKK